VPDTPRKLALWTGQSYPDGVLDKTVYYDTVVYVWNKMMYTYLSDFDVTKLY